MKRKQVRETDSMKSFPKDSKEVERLTSLMPQVDHSLDEKKLDTFLRSSPIHCLLRKMFEKSTYVDWKTFIETFQQTLNQFISFVGQDEFLLLLDDTVRTSPHYIMSIVAVQLLKEMKREPVSVCSFGYAYIHFPTIKHGLFVDDAIYTGERMGARLSECEARATFLKENWNRKGPTYSQMKMVLAVPYCNKAAVELMQKQHENVPVLFGRDIPSIGEVFTDKEVDALKTVFDYVEKEQVLLAFQHKYGDVVSCPLEFFMAIGKNCNDKQRGFIPSYEEFLK